MGSLQLKIMFNFLVRTPFLRDVTARQIFLNKWNDDYVKWKSEMDVPGLVQR